MKGRISCVMPNNRWVTVGDTDGAEEIAAWFANDLQYGYSGIDDEAAELARIESGEEADGFLGAGNAHIVSANRELVYVQDLFNDPDQRVLMTHAQAQDALAKYRAFMDHGYRDPSDPPGPFDVEYIAEGAEAFRLARAAGLTELIG